MLATTSTLQTTYKTETTAGICEELKPLLAHLPPFNPLENNKDLAVNAYNDLEVSLCASKPNLKYSSLLSESYLSFASSLSPPPTTPIRSRRRRRLS